MLDWLKKTVQGIPSPRSSVGVCSGERYLPMQCKVPVHFRQPEMNPAEDSKTVSLKSHDSSSQSLNKVEKEKDVNDNLLNDNDNKSNKYEKVPIASIGDKEVDGKNNQSLCSSIESIYSSTIGKNIDIPLEVIIPSSLRIKDGRREEGVLKTYERIVNTSHSREDLVEKEQPSTKELESKGKNTDEVPLEENAKKIPSSEELRTSIKTQDSPSKEKLEPESHRPLMAIDDVVRYENFIKSPSTASHFGDQSVCSRRSTNTRTSVVSVGLKSASSSRGLKTTTIYSVRSRNVYDNRSVVSERSSRSRTMANDNRSVVSRRSSRPRVIVSDNRSVFSRRSLGSRAIASGNRSVVSTRRSMSRAITSGDRLVTSRRSSRPSASYTKSGNFEVLRNTTIPNKIYGNTKSARPSSNTINPKPQMAFLSKIFGSKHQKKAAKSSSGSGNKNIHKMRIQRAIASQQKFNSNRQIINGGEYIRPGNVSHFMDHTIPIYHTERRAYMHPHSTERITYFENINDQLLGETGPQHIKYARDPNGDYLGPYHI